MKTDQLISALAEDMRPSGLRTSRAVTLALIAGLIVSVPLFLAWLGLRPDLATAVATWRFDMKIVLVALAALVAGYGVLKSTDPIPDARWMWPTGAILLLLVVMILAELAVTSREFWQARMIGSNAAVCLVAIPALALAPLIALLLALRSAAPASPALAGGSAGFLAATVAATLYAFHCPDDSPLFVATWYTLAIAGVSLVAAAAGHRLLKW